MLDDALSLSLSFLCLSLSIYLSIYLSPYLSLLISLSPYLSDIYAQPPVDGYLSHLHYHTRWCSFSYFIIYIYVYMIIRTMPHGEENIGIN